MCLLKRLLSKIMNHILQAISHFYTKRFRLGPTRHVYQFTMSYPRRIILLNSITQQMLPYVVKFLPSSVQTIYARTKKFPVFIRLTSFRSKLLELFHAFLIHRAQATFIHPILIHLNNNSVILWNSFNAWNLTFSFKVWPYPIQEDIFFMVDSYIKVNLILLNLTKFWQYLTLVSKYTTWNRWH